MYAVSIASCSIALNVIRVDCIGLYDLVLHESCFLYMKALD